MNNELIKKWVRHAGLELVSLAIENDCAYVTVKIPGYDATTEINLDIAAFDAASERAAESVLAYEFENATARLHVDWHLRGIQSIEPDALLLRRGDRCPCGGRAITGIDTKARVYRCERGIEHVFHRVTVIPHDGMVAVLYAEGSS